MTKILSSRFWFRIVAGLSVVLLAVLAYNFLKPTIIQQRPKLLVMTGLPIIWGEGTMPQILDGKRQSSAMYNWIDAHFRPIVLDHLDNKTLSKASLMLMAQPRVLSPEELVAFDDWVHKGGHVLILTDPMLHWLSEYPVGDPRSPPLMSLLDPLLTHWGITLDLTSLHDHETVVTTAVKSQGKDWRLAMTAPGQFTSDGKYCQIQQKGLIADCRIGKGRALLVADADLMADSLWMVHSPEQRHADNPVIVTLWLDSLAGVQRDMETSPAS